MDDGRLLVSTCTLPLSGLGQLRVGCIERRGDAPPREMTAQAEAIPPDRMRLIDRPEANIKTTRQIFGNLPRFLLWAGLLEICDICKLPKLSRLCYTNHHRQRGF